MFTPPEIFPLFFTLHFTLLILLTFAIATCRMPYFTVTLTSKMLEFYYQPHFPVVHVCRFPYIQTTGSIFYTLILHYKSHIMLQLVVVPYHMPYFVGKYYQQKCFNFINLSQFPVVHVSRIRYIHTIFHFVFTLLLVILHVLSCCHLP